MYHRIYSNNENYSDCDRRYALSTQSGLEEWMQQIRTVDLKRIITNAQIFFLTITDVQKRSEI